MESRPDRDPLRALVLAGAREFNAGRYFEAHEVLEDGLDAVPDDLWNLFLGLIQVAVGYHKVGQGLREGGAKMLVRALAKLAQYPEQAGGVNVAALRERVGSDVEKLRRRRTATAEVLRDPPRLQPLADR